MSHIQCTCNKILNYCYGSNVVIESENFNYRPAKVMNVIKQKIRTFLKSSTKIKTQLYNFLKFKRIWRYRHRCHTVLHDAFHCNSFKTGMPIKILYIFQNKLIFIKNILVI